MTDRLVVGDVLEQFSETVGDGPEPTVLTLTERRGFVPQADRFNKRLAIADTSKYHLVRRGDIAFNPYLLWAGAIAQNTVCDEGVISPLYPTFRVRPGYDPRFVGQLLLWPQIVSMYDSIAFGSVPRRRRTSIQDFLSLSLPLIPPLEEQKRISAILDKADDLLAKRRAAIAHLDSLTQSIFLDMFGSGTLPRMSVEDAAAASKGSIRTGPFGSQLLHSEFTDSGIRVLGIDNVVSNSFKWGAPRFISTSKYEQLSKFTVRPRDVLVTIMGTCGRVAVVPESIPTAINTKHLCCITLDHERMLPEYLRASLLFDPAVRRHLGEQARGAVMPGLNIGLIKSASVQAPPFEVQQRFVDRVSAIDSATAAASDASALTTNLASSLQSRAFRGEL